MALSDKIGVKKQGKPGGSGLKPNPEANGDGTPKKKREPINFIFRCGHTGKLPDSATANCSTCREKIQQARKTRNAAKQAARAADSPKRQQMSRLPDGSTFHESYDATAVLWTGTLIGGVVFSASASGRLPLWRKLDAMYREWAAIQEEGP
jgi:hypothetical protein